MLTSHSKGSSVFCGETIRAVCISVYMRINTHSPLEIFSKGNFFYLFIYFLEFSKQMISYNNVIKLW